MCPSWVSSLSLDLSWKLRSVVDHNILTNFTIESYIEPINNFTNMMLIKNILLLSLAVTVSGKIDSFLTFFEFECVSIGFMKNYPFWFLLYLLPLPILVLLKLNNYSLNLKTDWSTTSFTATDSSSVFLLPLDYCIFFTFFLCPRCFCFRFFFTCCPFFSLLLFLK